MNKQKLKDGMILELRNRERLLLTNPIMRDFNGYIKLENYSEGLKNNYNKEFDIVKIYDSKSLSLSHIFEDEFLQLIWEREEREEIKLKDREVEVLKALKTLGWKWLARDKDGGSYAYEDKPIKKNDCWLNSVCWQLRKIENLFNFIKWQDDEPTKIDDLLKENEK